mmetsp:Transcript_28703/g.66846  ORF Transcript_28703/g.66846 Transcript_28703/m.66846 type:complete len:614 (-) Transcript_28703:82-1923(-)
MCSRKGSWRAQSVGFTLGKASVEEVEAPLQPLALACRPLCGQEAFQGYLEVASPPVDVMDQQPRDFGYAPQVSEEVEDWPRHLKDVNCGKLPFEEVRRALDDAALNALLELREKQLILAQLAAEMRHEFKSTLKTVSDSGNTLLSAAGDLQRNRNIVFKMVPATSRGSRQAAEELMLCRTSVLAAVKANGEVLLGMQERLRPAHLALVRSLHETQASLRRASETLQFEWELVQMGESRGWLFTDVAEGLYKRYSGMFDAVSQDSHVLQNIAEEMSNTRKAFRRTVVINRSVIRQADMSLHCDQEVVFNWALGHVSDGRKCDRNFILTVVEANGEALEQVPEEFQHDREIVQIAVQRSGGWALQFAAEPLKHDREIVLAAVGRSGFALEHAAEELKRDRAVVLAAVSTNGEALEFAAEELRQDREVVLAAVLHSSGMALQVADQELQGDEEIALAAVQANGLVLEHVSPELRADRQIVSAALQANGLALEHAAESLRADHSIVLAAVRSNPLALRFASPALCGCDEVVTAALAGDGFALEYASEELRHDRRIVLLAVQEGGYGVLEYTSSELREDSEMVAAAEATSCEKRKLAEAPPDETPLWQGSADSECVRL